MLWASKLLFVFDKYFQPSLTWVTKVVTYARSALYNFLIILIEDAWNLHSAHTTVSINDTAYQHYAECYVLFRFMLSVIMLRYYAECHYAECHYAECHYLIVVAP
jgi:hypothetical protein